ncbi:cobalamin B12-binding domain-containing protein [Natranaerofaba carboxydovora]|uniref:cobalamin B12-binding domain-containing protein n=1 Tax=Natranaerofaba carboxydovora TaxID=2742683 RepID=UPI001F130AF3|nr:cobalamin-dependent protein [Natranaerofaba carboxydovora]UMZ74760.1 Methionine synthase [Natranaerofaba carboxydovora]
MSKTDLAKAVAELDEKKIFEIIDEKLANNEDPMGIIKECNEGMIEVGNLYSEGKYFISELMFSGEIFKEIMAKLDDKLEDTAEEEEVTGENVVVIGTVKDDIHDIGKNIVINLLKGSGFDVIDMGVDVPPEKFVEKVKETGTKVLGLSALLNSTFPEMKKVIDAIEEAGLRDQVKIIIGGAPTDEQVKEYCGADYYAQDASSGVEICREIITQS